jgi:hypothetical protein
MPGDRPHDVSGMTAGELERAKRDLLVSLSLAFPGSPVSVPILARLSAIDAELADRTGKPSRIYLCSCGFGTDDREWLQGHLFEHPDHHERDTPRALLILGPTTEFGFGSAKYA